MKKGVTFAEYRAIQKLSFNDFNRWITEFYTSAFQDGINLTNSDVVAELDENRLFDIIRSVKGIGESRTKEAVDKILKEGTFI